MNCSRILKNKKISYKELNLYQTSALKFINTDKKNQLEKYNYFKKNNFVLNNNIKNVALQ